MLAAADPDTGVTRGEMQALGARLEKERPGEWLMEPAVLAPRPAVVDAARTEAQVVAARALLPGCLVVHLDAPLEVRRSRFANRVDPIDHGVAFDAMRTDPLEQGAEDLRRLADLVVDARASPQASLDLVLQASTDRMRDDGG